MPVIVHHAESEDAQGMLDQRFSDAAEKGQVVLVLAEERRLAVGAVEHVIDVVAWRDAWESGHVPKATENTERNKGSCPLYLVRCTTQ